MTSSQPYLIRAIYEWIVDNDLTPYLMVDAKKRGTIVPEDYLDELGRIILNISPNATSGLLITNEEVTFSARFSGQSMGIVVPTYSVRAIYARENGQGMMFNENDEPAQDVAKKRATLEAIEGTGTHGVTVKAGESNGQKNDDKKESADTDDSAAKPEKSSTESGSESGPDKPAPKKGKKGGPHLKVVK